MLRHYTSVIILCSIFSVTALAYQKPGAPVSLATHNVTASDERELAVTLNIQQPGSISISATATPSETYVSIGPVNPQVYGSNSKITVPLTLSHSLNKVKYVNLFVTFLAENGATSHRALAVKIQHPAVDASISQKSQPSANTPVYLPARETVIN